MALSSDEQEQIREIVRSELKQGSPFFGALKGRMIMLIVIFLSVLALHILVIGGFTLYHLFHAH